MKRTFLAVLCAYALWNPTIYSIGYGYYWSWSGILSGNGMEFWPLMGFGAATLAVALILAYLSRRISLATSQANLFLLGLYTTIVTAALVMAVLIFEKLFGDISYVTAAQWLWQIPVGFFVGMGLSWSIVDRQLSGVYATDSREVEGEAHHG